MSKSIEEQKCVQDGVEAVTSQKAAVLRTLKQWIRQGKFQVDEPLPSERVISNLLKLPRHTVRVALKKLEEDGWIERRGRSRVVTMTSEVQESQLDSKTIVVLAQEHWSGTTDIKPGDLWYIVMGTLQALGQSAVAGQTIDPDDITAERFMKLISDKPSGVIAFQDVFIHATSLAILQGIHASKIPLCVYGYKPELQIFDTVESDQAAGAYALTRYLHERGRRRILRLWEYRADIPDNEHWLKKRDEGYEAAVKDAGLESLPAYRVPELPFYAGTKAKFDMRARYLAGFLVEIFTEYPDIDAVMAISDSASFPLASALQRLGRRPNEDVDIVGYDNYWQLHDYQQWMPLKLPATIDKHNASLGSELVNLLIERISGKLQPEPVHRRIKPELIICE